MIATVCPRAALAVLVCAAGLSAPGLARADTTVRCESSSHQTSHCRADTHGGVRLVRQLSHAGCWQNDTWGYDRDGVWVSNGCRAEFATAGRWQDDRRDDDHDGRNAAIAGAVVLGLIGAAVLADKHDDRDDRHDGGYYDDGYHGQSITCESRNQGYQRCPADIGRRHVEIERVLSRGECRYGYSWGVDRGAVWVDRGCRATFSVR